MFRRRNRTNPLVDEIAALRIQIGGLQVQVGDLNEQVEDLRCILNPPPPPPTTVEGLAEANDGALLTGAAIRDVAMRVIKLEKRSKK